jgi:hypothetical protein
MTSSSRTSAAPSLVCCVNRAADLPPAHQDVASAEWPVTIGRAYLVGGMSLYANVVSVVVEDDRGGISWVPIAAFEAGDFVIPEGWHFALMDAIREPEGPLMAAWGYRELVFDEDGHWDELAYSEPRAMALFRERTGQDPKPGTTAGPSE